VVGRKGCRIKIAEGNTNVDKYISGASLRQRAILLKMPPKLLITLGKVACPSKKYSMGRRESPGKSVCGIDINVTSLLIAILCG